MCVSLRHGPRAPPLTYVATSTLPPPRLSLIALEIAHASTFRTRPICALPSPLTAQSIDLNSPRVMTANSSDRLGVFWHYPPKSSDLGGLATSQTPHIAPPVALSQIPSHVALAIASFFLPCGKSNHYRFVSVGLAQGSREVESETKETRRGDGTGGNAAREGGRDACGGSGARSVVVRH